MVRQNKAKEKKEALMKEKETFMNELEFWKQRIFNLEQEKEADMKRAKLLIELAESQALNGKAAYELMIEEYMQQIKVLKKKVETEKEIGVVRMAGADVNKVRQNAYHDALTPEAEWADARQQQWYKKLDAWSAGWLEGKKKREEIAMSS